MKYIPLWAKILIWLSIIGTLLGFIGFGALLYYGFKTGAEDRRVMNTAIQDIQLPAEYKMVDTDYETENCYKSLCATVTYESADGTPLDEEIIDAALKEQGYALVLGNYYTNTVDGKKIDIDVDQYEPTRLVIDISL